MAYFIEMIIIDKILRIVFTFAIVNSVSLFVLCIIDGQSNFERSSTILSQTSKHELEGSSSIALVTLLLLLDPMHSFFHTYCTG